jgi:hypothetical protein
MDGDKNSGFYFLRYDISDKIGGKAKNYSLGFATSSEPTSVDHQIRMMLLANQLNISASGKEPISQERYQTLKQQSFNYFNELQGCSDVIVYNFKPEYSKVLPKEDTTVN